MSAELEGCIVAVEQRLDALGAALGGQRAEVLQAEAAELQRALHAAVEQLRRSARGGELPPPWRQRLARASARVAAQRESLARAAAALDRAIDVLLPDAAPRTGYAASGLSERKPSSGRAQA